MLLTNRNSYKPDMRMKREKPNMNQIKRYMIIKKELTTYKDNKSNKSS